MTFGVPAETYEVDPVVAKVLDMLFILHADHEQNCSTSTVRMVGSSQRQHVHLDRGGHRRAVRAAARRREPGRASRCSRASRPTAATSRRSSSRVKNKEPGVKLMGFGHRVYKNYDPRAAIVKKATRDVLEALGVDDPLLDLAIKLEEIALADDYFVERKLYPNVDFYTGVIYKAMGFPTRMFTVLFALGRLPGWIAHWREMITDPDTKIGRPRQVYTGAAERDYAAIAQRA